MKILLATVVLFVAPLLSHADQNPTPTNVGLSNFSTISVSTSTLMLPRNVNRAELVIENVGGASVVVKPGSAPGSITDGILLAAGQILLLSPPPVDALYATSASGSQKMVLIEFVK